LSIGKTITLAAATALLATGLTFAHDHDAASYRLRPEWSGPCQKSSVIDVNLGNAPDAFVKVAGCQVTGKAPDATVVASWSQRLRNDDRLRRIDVVETLCREARRSCRLSYSNPWIRMPQVLLPPCDKRFKRDIGAVVMFFFACPHKTNCGMDWANNHVTGMKRRDPSLSWDGHDGYYNADNPGFWRKELRAARNAGLQYIVPNLYGPDMARGQVDRLAAALAQEDDPVKIGLFDDTWEWGVKTFGRLWSEAPDLSDTESAARTLYQSKWRPYFRKIPPPLWYRIDGRPVIYFYNAGTLKPASKAAAVLVRMKQYFRSDFGIEPYVAVDDAFFADPDMAKVADTRFRWDTLAGDFHAPDGTVAVEDRLSRSEMNGRVMTNAFVRWDSHGRDANGTHMFDDRMIKGPERLQDVLARTQDADNLLIETWNDLGEGTGINEAYDYYYEGEWLRPDAFMRVVRTANCRN